MELINSHPSQLRYIIFGILIIALLFLLFNQPAILIQGDTACTLLDPVSSQYSACPMDPVFGPEYV